MTRTFSLALVALVALCSSSAFAHGRHAVRTHNKKNGTVVVHPAKNPHAKRH